MTTLVQIGLDDPFRLASDVHYFEYKGFEFKLVQTEAPERSDVILTLAPGHDDDYVAEAYQTAGEFVTGLSWQLDVGMAVRPLGTVTVGAQFGLKQAKPNISAFTRLPPLGKHGGYDIGRIARIENEEQKTALTLYREAGGSNKVTLSILFSWQVLETRGETAVQWVNEVVSGDLPNDLVYTSDLISKVDTRGMKIGKYLLEDCRHAIAHVNRQPGRRQLLFDDYDEDRRLGASKEILARLARYYIKQELGVQNHLYLKGREDRIPIYVAP